MTNDYGQAAQKIIAACEEAKASNAAWLAQRGLTVESARRLPLTRRLELQEAYGQEQFAKRFPHLAK